MKKILTISVYLILLSVSTLFASEENNNPYNANGYGKSYIFTEQNIEFSIYPDGQFDFVYLGQNNNISINTPTVNISFNSGYNYDMYVQYDDYGAVIQIENIPIYYDEYGRIIQAGSVDIRYNNRRIVRVGGMFIHYNPYGYYSHFTGYINQYNYYYVYRPWHVYFAPPIYTSCIVYNHPYRRYYSPIRYDFNTHNNYYRNRGRNNVSYTNGRRNFHKPGSRVHYKDGRSVANKNYSENRRNKATNNVNKIGNITRRSKMATSKSSNTHTSKRGKLSIRKTTKVRSIARTKPSVSSNNIHQSRGNSYSKTRTQKTSYKRSSDSQRLANHSKYLKTTHKKATNKTYQSNTYKRNSKKVASTSHRSHSNEGRNSSKKVTSQRGRGL